MAGLKSFPRMTMALFMLLMLAWPVAARADWFVRSNEIAYRLALKGQDKQALAHWDHSAEGWYGRGTTLMHLGRMQEAEESLRESLALAPHKTGFSDRLMMPVNSRPHFMASVWYNLGNALYAQGELVAARDAWLKALDFEPGHAKARHNVEIVDRLLKAREKPAQPPVSGVAGKGGHKPSGKKGGHAPVSPPHQQQHASLPLHLPGRTSSASVSQQGAGKHGGHGGHGASRSEVRSVTPSSHAASQTLTGGDKQGRTPGTVQGMSRHEALQQLRLVEEGVSVFLRHRLSEKGRGSANGGKPW